MSTQHAKDLVRRHLPSFAEHDLDASLKVALHRRSGPVSAAELLAGWAYSVSRFEREAVLAEDDPAAWGADDYIGALFGRDDLAELANQHSTELPSVFHTTVATIDDTFRAMTVEDEPEHLQRFQAHERIGTDWWWKRIPKSGPVRHDLVG